MSHTNSHPSLFPEQSFHPDTFEDRYAGKQENLHEQKILTSYQRKNPSMDVSADSLGRGGVVLEGRDKRYPKEYNQAQANRSSRSKKAELAANLTAVTGGGMLLGGGIATAFNGGLPAAATMLAGVPIFAGGMAASHAAQGSEVKAVNKKYPVKALGTEPAWQDTPEGQNYVHKRKMQAAGVAIAGSVASLAAQKSSQAYYTRKENGKTQKVHTPNFKPGGARPNQKPYPSSTDHSSQHSFLHSL